MNVLCHLIQCLPQSTVFQSLADNAHFLSVLLSLFLTQTTRWRLIRPSTERANQIHRPTICAITGRTLVHTFVPAILSFFSFSVRLQPSVFICIQCSLIDLDQVPSFVCPFGYFAHTIHRIPGTS